MQMSLQNSWSEISTVLLGRTDNTIKNFCNCNFRMRRASLSEKLTSYLAQCIELEDPRPLDVELRKNELI